MSQKLLLQSPSLIQLLVVLQFFMITIANAYPYVMITPSTSASASETRSESASSPSLAASFTPSRHLVKRAFDRFDNSGVFSFGAKRFDRYDGYDQFENSKYVLKRAFDRLDNADFGLRRKRSFDRMGGTEFGLMKRSAKLSTRDDLIDQLAESIMALRHARTLETSSSPIIFSYEERK